MDAVATALEVLQVGLDGLHGNIGGMRDRLHGDAWGCPLEDIEDVHQALHRRATVIGRLDESHNIESYRG